MAGYLIVAGLAFAAGVVGGVLAVKIGWVNVQNINRRSIS